MQALSTAADLGNLLNQVNNISKSTNNPRIINLKRTMRTNLQPLLLKGETLAPVN